MWYIFIKKIEDKQFKNESSSIQTQHKLYCV